MDSARKDVVLMSAENIFYSLIGFVGAVVLVIAFLIFVYYRSIRKSASSTVEPLQLWIPKSRTTMEKISADLSGTYPLMSRNVAKVAGYADLIDPCSSSYAFRSSIVPMIVYEKPQVINMKKALNELYADRNFFQILSIEKLEGTFGEMKWAIWKRNMEGTIGNVDYEEDNVCFEKRVIVKTLKVTADQRYLRKFLEEALAFFHVEPHENLAQVTAVTSYDCLNNLEQKMIDFPLVCYSHNGFGNLKKFLISCRNGQTNAQSKNPNIATRNCLVSKIRDHDHDNLFVQICDSALSKDFFPNDYHCLGDNENRPVKWMAHESLVYNSFNSSTDVWSFGVTLWELLTCSQQPYLDIDPEEMATILEHGKRLSQPYNCPDKLNEFFILFFLYF
ncbi:unnamed protein product [Onchocerca flexuosa]|uniref:Protein kinase domain-containing protein n=1 Tax=Onchocerca flexuosa TaxID=387005 RepID=A0A183H5C4_9BILA|nr:unnamed protein product [Onchocerca flexuosa]